LSSRKQQIGEMWFVASPGQKMRPYLKNNLKQKGLAQSVVQEVELLTGKYKAQSSNPSMTKTQTKPSRGFGCSSVIQNMKTCDPPHHKNKIKANPGETHILSMFASFLHLFQCSCTHAQSQICIFFF
jgi:hypothetical protein